MEAGGRQWKIAFLEGKDRCMLGRFKGWLFPAGPPQGEKAPSGGREPPQGGEAWGHFYFGGIRMAPSRRIVSPFSMSLVMMACTSLA